MRFAEEVLIDTANPTADPQKQYFGANSFPVRCSGCRLLPPSPRRLRASPAQSPRRAADSKPDAGAGTAATAPSFLSPTASLFLVAVLWGSNPICLRYLERGSDPPPAALLTVSTSG